MCLSLFAVVKIWLFPHFKSSVFLRAPALNLVSRQVVEREEVQHFIIKDLFGSFRPEKRKFSRCVQGEFFIPSRDIKQRAIFQPHVFSFVPICLISFHAP